MSVPELEYDLYRCTAHGGSKDWAIAINDDGDIRILHCATGQTVRRTHIPRSQFASATEERERRIRESLAKGYERVGLATVVSNRLSPTSTPTVPAQTPGEHWEITHPLEIEALRERLAWAVEQLSDHVAPDVIEYDAQAVVLRIGSRSPTGTQWWVLGLCDEGGIQPTGRGGGIILLEQGLLPRLIILYLLRCFPGAIQISDASDGTRKPMISRRDDFLGQTLFDYERVQGLGEKLELCLGRFSLLDNQDGSEPFWI